MSSRGRDSLGIEGVEIGGGIGSSNDEYGGSREWVWFASLSLASLFCWFTCNGLSS